ncbi:MAG: BTAD domain-containing putative transcriptional regulator, partial [Chloroflexota bacterium]|nr:BTAD domain-containing putative transcriptional regulator [Chloroflexota bacterium]
MDEAMALYRADFLQECYDDWALLERERLRELYLSALERLITPSKQQGNYEQALAYAQRLAAADPLREAAHRELMRLYHLLNRPQAALEQFAALRDLLARELDIPPTPATLALYREIKAAMEEQGQPHLPAAAPPPPLLRKSSTELAADLGHLPFVGRASERGALLDGLQAAIQGRGGLALVEGEAGVGKTRLVNEVAADARWRGFQVGMGKAEQLTASAPYQLLRDALSPLLTLLRVAQLAELVDPLWLNAAAPLLPPIAEHTRDIAVLAPLDPREEQRRLQEGLAQCLIGLASTTPLLLILEDLHWADKATLAALSHLAVRLSESRVLLILTYRTAEARGMTAVWETLGSLDRARPLVRLRLRPFERAEAVSLVQRALSTTDVQTVALAGRLQQETGGNPLFLVETLKSLLERGALATLPDGGWVFPPQDISFPMPISVRELIGQRVARLSLAPRTALEQIAVLGDDADFAVLSQISTAGTVSLLSTLEDLVRYGFLVETATRYRFEHDCIQEMTYQAIPPERRRSLHRLAGATLARARPERIERMAYHFDQGEDWGQALIYSQRAGDGAKAIYAGDEAISHYTRALKAWSLLREPDQAIKIELHHARGEVCQETGRFDQAEVDFQALYDLARAMGDKTAKKQLFGKTQKPAPAVSRKMKGAAGVLGAHQTHALNHLSYLQFQRGDFGGAREIAQQ